jgi:hypothetical protein
MKNYFCSLCLLSFLLLSCGKESSFAPPANHEVKYEVITSSGEWFGEWLDENNNRSVITQPPMNKSGWTLTFTPKKYPFDLTCHATAECICHGTPTSPDVTVNLYVDGKLVKTETNNFAKGVTTAVYKLEQ